jgi:hypothetical protein
MDHKKAGQPRWIGVPGLGVFGKGSPDVSGAAPPWITSCRPCRRGHGRVRHQLLPFQEDR